MAQLVEDILERNSEFRLLEPLTVTNRARLPVTAVPVDSLVDLYKDSKETADHLLQKPPESISLPISGEYLTNPIRDAFRHGIRRVRRGDHREYNRHATLS